ncbi:MAG: matrixin family metalloprotease [Candidatus Pacearchaeota archaeon]
MSKAYIVIICILLALLSMSLYLSYNLYFKEEEIFQTRRTEANYLPENNLENFTLSSYYPNGILFHDNLRFEKSEITFFISESCNENRKKNVRKAFENLNRITILSFYEVLEEENANIEVICSDKEEDDGFFYFTAGEGGPLEIINATKFMIIKKGRVQLYRDESCKEPIIALHEIMHVLGFQHSTNKKDIMYNVSNCDQRVLPEQIEMINELYSIPSHPDLLFGRVESIKKGVYIKFDLEIFNYGLNKSDKFNLTIYAGSDLKDLKKVDYYEFNEIEAGAGRKISVENQKIPRNTRIISFLIDEEDQIKEIEEKNNKVTLSID